VCSCVVSPAARSPVWQSPSHGGLGCRRSEGWSPATGRGARRRMPSPLPPSPRSSNRPPLRTEGTGEATDGTEGGQGRPASPSSTSPPLPHGLRGRISALPQPCWLAPRPEGSGSRLRSLVGHRLLLHDAASSGGAVPAPPLDNVGGACGLAQQLRARLDGKAVLRPPFGKKAAEGGETPNLAARQHLEAQAQQLAVAVSALILRK
jgi:hypothetical protein